MDLITQFYESMTYDEPADVDWRDIVEEDSDDEEELEEKSDRAPLNKYMDDVPIEKQPDFLEYIKQRTKVADPYAVNNEAVLLQLYKEFIAMVGPSYPQINFGTQVNFGEVLRSAIDDVYKHLPGRHDQKVHGRKKSGQNLPSISEDNDYATELGYRKWEQGKTYSIKDPDTGDVIKGILGKGGRPVNAEEITVYWGNTDTPQDSLRDLVGGNTAKGSIKKNVFVTTGREYAQRYAVPIENKNESGQLYSFTIEPGEAWLPYGGPSETDGLELTATVSKDRMRLIEEYKSLIKHLPGRHDQKLHRPIKGEKVGDYGGLVSQVRAMTKRELGSRKNITEEDVGTIRSKIFRKVGVEPPDRYEHAYTESIKSKFRSDYIRSVDRVMSSSIENALDVSVGLSIEFNRLLADFLVREHKGIKIFRAVSLTGKGRLGLTSWSLSRGSAEAFGEDNLPGYKVLEKRLDPSRVVSISPFVGYFTDSGYGDEDEVLLYETSVSKHLPGQHDQKTHAGEIAGQAVSEPTTRKRLSDLTTDEWKALSDEEKDAYANAKESIKARINGLTEKYGQHNLNAAIQDIASNRLKQVVDIITEDTGKILVDRMKGYGEALAKAGIDETTAKKMVAQATDVLIIQENESLGRQLGDHGIRHVLGDVDMALDILSKHPAFDDPKAIVATYIAGIYHDTGYTTPPGGTVGMDGRHPQWSKQHYDANMYADVSKSLGKDWADKVGVMIQTHDSSEVDWNDPLTSALRIADNMALFHKEKLPGLFKYVPQNIKVLIDLGEGDIDVDSARKMLRANVTGAGLSKPVTERLLKAADEVGKFSPKYTLGMLGGHLEKVEWKTDHLEVTAYRNMMAIKLQKSLDLGQRQFKKFAETYLGEDLSKLQSDGFTFDKDGKPVIRFTIIGEEIKALLQAILDVKHLPGQHDQQSHAGSDLYAEIRSWTGNRKNIAEAAIYNMGGGDDGVVIRGQSGEISGIASYNRLTNSSILNSLLFLLKTSDADREWFEVHNQDFIQSGDYFYVSDFATREPGHGRHTFQHVVDDAAKEGHGVILYSLQSASGFYTKMGMRKFKFGGIVDSYTKRTISSYFYFTPEDVKALEGRGILLKSLVDDEPEDGVFAVEPGFLAKHLAGQHDQNKHGRPGYAEIKGKATERARELVQAFLIKYDLPREVIQVVHIVDKRSLRGADAVHVRGIVALPDVSEYSSEVDFEGDFLHEAGHAIDLAYPGLRSRFIDYMKEEGPEEFDKIKKQIFKEPDLAVEKEVFAIGYSYSVFEKMKLFHSTHPVTYKFFMGEWRK